MNLNKAFVLGNLTRDPELKALPSGMNVATFGIATNRVWKDRDGNQQQSAEFHNIVCFGRQGEICAQYLRKGQLALVEGRLQTRNWDGNDGSKRYRTEIVADRVQFGPKSAGGVGGYGTQGQGNSQNIPNNPDAVDSRDVSDEASIQYPQDKGEVRSEDIPF